MRVKSCFEKLSSLLLAAILFVTSGSAELPASSQVWCLLTCDNCHVCGCLCAFPTTCVWNRKRESETLDTKVWVTAWRSACSVNQICVWQSVLARLFACMLDVAIEEACSEVPSAHLGTAWDGSSVDLQRAPLSGTWAHPCQMHTSVSAARGLLPDHKPQDCSEPAENTWCKSDRAALTHLQRWKTGSGV